MKNIILKISNNLVLPIQVATEVIAFLGRRGQGKTYAAQRLAELFYQNNVPFIVLDPVGNWYGLRLAAGGKTAGIPIPVFGGLHGDIPLESSSGKMIADLVIDRNVSVVLDVSQFESDSEKNRFIRDFGTRFYFRRKQRPAACHVFLEEAQEIVPQNPVGDGEKFSLHAFQRIAKLGRNYGIGVSLLTQRPQEVHKKVLNLTELLFAFQLVGKHERRAVANWIRDKAIDEDIDQELPRLQRGAPHAWSPAWLRVSKVVKITKKWTFDASATPEIGQSGKTRALTPIDMEQLRIDMAATIERAKADDPKELHQRIRKLEGQLKQRQPVETKKIEVPVIGKKQLADLRDCTRRMEKVANSLAPIQVSIDALRSKTDLAVHDLHETIDRALTKQVRSIPGGEAPKKPVKGLHIFHPGDTARTSDSALTKGPRRILSAIAQHGDASREQLAVLTGYKTSSRNTYLQRLREFGYIEQIGNILRATNIGVAALGNDFEELPTGDALREHWLSTLPKGERKILLILCTHYPQNVSRDQISEHTGYAISSRNTYLQRLLSRKLVTANTDGVRATDILFN